jgi:hypothetical protein
MMIEPTLHTFANVSAVILSFETQAPASVCPHLSDLEVRQVGTVAREKQLAYNV